jgi:hypothetical protein
MPNADGGAIGLVLRYLRAIERKADRLIDALFFHKLRNKCIKLFLCFAVPLTLVIRD